MKRLALFVILSTLFAVAFCSIMVQSAGNLPVRVNITLTEIVNRNVTFGKSALEFGENVSHCTIEGILNITNPNNVTINEVYVSFENTANMLTNFSFQRGRTGYQINFTEDNYTIIVPELMMGNFSQWVYNVSCVSVAPPLSMDTVYSGINTGIDRKVLAGENWTITQNVSNALVIDYDLNNVKIEIRTNGIFWNTSNGSTYQNFTLLKLLNSGDSSNVTGNGSNNWNWNWTPGGGTINRTSVFNISFVVGAPANVGTSGIYLALTERLIYNVFYAASNITATKVSAKGPVYFREKKQIIRPADDNPNSTNVTWQADAYVNTSFNISYTLTKVTMWVTNTLNPGDQDTVYGRLNVTYVPNKEINKSGFWFTQPSGTAGVDRSWAFNFSDGSVSSSPPPIVWMRPFFEIVNSYNQIINSSYTRNGDDYYLKYVYVVNGYWLQVDKNISSIEENIYTVNITVENIGNAWTPSGLTVTVYDFIPASFNYSQLSQNPSQTQYLTSESWNGTAIRWNIPRKAPYNSSLGPKTESVLNKRWSVKYNVNGTGQYKVSDLYIVGLDPRKVDGAGSHEGITVISEFMSGTKEMVYLVGLIALIGLNILNFIMTRRINKRLE